MNDTGNLAIFFFPPSYIPFGLFEAAFLLFMCFEFLLTVQSTEKNFFFCRCYQLKGYTDNQGIYFVPEIGCPVISHVGMPE